MIHSFDSIHRLSIISSSSFRSFYTTYRNQECKRTSYSEQVVRCTFLTRYNHSILLHKQTNIQILHAQGLPRPSLSPPRPSPSLGTGSLVISLSLLILDYNYETVPKRDSFREHQQKRAMTHAPPKQDYSTLYL